MYDSLHSVVIGNLIVSVAGLLPGYYATLCLIDGWGRKPIQYLGFAMLTVLLAVLGKISPPIRSLSEEFIDARSDSGHLSWSSAGLGSR